MRAPFVEAPPHFGDEAPARAAEGAGRGLSDREQRLSSAVALYFDLVWRSLRRFGVPERDTDDAAQVVFLTLDRRLASVSVEQERAFLVAVAVRVAANERRRIRRSWESPMELPEHASLEPSPELALEHRQSLRELEAALDTMTEDQRNVFVLYEIEGFSLPEISAALQVPVGTATSRLRRARETFERWVAERAAKGDRS